MVNRVVLGTKAARSERSEIVRIREALIEGVR